MILKKTFRPLPSQIRSLDEKRRTITFVASTEAVDRYGDIIRVAGWKLDNYRKNPVVLWGHRSGDPPIGRCVEIGIESNPPALVQKVEFATKDVYPFADTVYRLYKDGFLRAVSVGFLPLEEPKPRFSLEGEYLGEEFLSQELLELSAVAVPANPEALGRAIRKGVLTDAEARDFARRSFDPLTQFGKALDAEQIDFDLEDEIRTILGA